MIDSNGILIVEPSSRVSPLPLIDELTRKMTAAWRRRRESDDCFRGVHWCPCGATSDNRHHYIGSEGILTNSLCIHYLAFHREELPQEELDKVRALAFGEEEPTEEELHSPHRKLSRPAVYR